MKTVAWIALAALALAAPAGLAAQAQDRVAESSPPGQPPSRIIHGKSTPFIVDGRLLLYQGEIVVFAVSPEGGGPVFVVAGKAAEDRPLADGELRARLEGGMMSINSGHSRWLNYSARLSTSGGKPKPTSVCTIMAGKGAFESWQGPIAYLSLGDFKPAAEGSLVCR
ncbi:MAG: hypothetical protein JWR84_3567 [Caulobacter sp.]|nr:hypothetical protein [Caulobacter sp.]